MPEYESFEPPTMSSIFDNAKVAYALLRRLMKGALFELLWDDIAFISIADDDVDADDDFATYSRC